MDQNATYSSLNFSVLIENLAEFQILSHSGFWCLDLRDNVDTRRYLTPSISICVGKYSFLDLEKRIVLPFHGPVPEN